MSTPHRPVRRIARAALTIAAVALAAFACTPGWTGAQTLPLPGAPAAPAPAAPKAATPVMVPATPPLPVTVITRQMLLDIGARNLKEALLAYVPGMTFVQDQNEVVVAMRGVYGSSQQKILVLIDGHVLNSRSYMASNPDFSIGLDNVDRIEVTRGPGSSIYGNGALTAVINIHTRSTEGLDTASVSAGIGSFGQTKLGGLFAATMEKGAGVLLWGSYYRSAGQSMSVLPAPAYVATAAGTTAILDGFSGPASHDVGVTFKAKGFSLLAAHRFGKYTEPFSGGGPTGQTYAYDDYQSGEGVGPGLGIGAFNFDASYEHALSASTTLRVRAYFDQRDIWVHAVTDPVAKSHQLARWREWDLGVIAQASGSYDTSHGTGRWTAGAQFDSMKVNDSRLLTGTGGGWTTVGARGSVLELGHEGIYSGFIEVRQPITAKWMADGAIRYDLKIRHSGANIGQFSPQAGLSFTPDDRWSVTASYSSSFADAPYWYRYNSFPSYRGGRDLKPEFLRAFQLTPSAKITGRVIARCNLFFNTLQDAVWRNKNAGPTEPIYQNGGVLKTIGAEPEVTYTGTMFNVTANLTWQHVTSAVNQDVVGGRIENVPAVTANVVVNVNPWAAAKRDIWMNLTARFIGAQASPINVTVAGTAYREPDRVVKSALVLNAGVRAGHLFNRHVFVDARVYNLLDARYEQGGSVAHPYPQAGRSFMVTAGIGF